jgi:general secretion pathway protein H
MAPRGGRRAGGAPGFTLIELLVVIALIAIGSAVVTLALRDPAAAMLDREAVRLSALLEAARAESRAAGVPARFELRREMPGNDPQASDGGPVHFRFVGSGDVAALPSRWLDPATTAEIVGAPTLVLGPEPILPPQRIALRLGNQRVVVATDGLAPFRILDADDTVPR